jgi:ketol-acid reductoisomerase
MRKVLSAIQDGSFAKEWIAEMNRGAPSLVEARAKLAQTEIEQVGKRLRALGEREVQGAHGVPAIQDTSALLR